MSLPSQAARSSGPMGRSLMYRRRRRRQIPLAPLGIGAIAVGLVLFVGWWAIWGREDDPAGAAPGETIALTEPATTQTQLPGGPRSTTPPLRDNALTGAGVVREPERAVTGRETARETTPVVRAPEPPVPVVDPASRSGGSLLDSALGDGGGARDAAPTGQPSRPVEAERRSPVQRAIASADALIGRNDLLAARQVLNDALLASGDEVEQGLLRSRLAELNEELVFSPRIAAGDPLVESYTVVSGDALSKIATKRDLATEWQFIQRVNGLKNANQIRVGQKLKLVRGPFHAVVRKADYRLDLYFGPPDDPREWTYVRSFRVGLGEGNSTPVGEFVVRANGKLENPGWVNPRDSTERYDRNDPANPIGEHWIGLRGIGDAAVYTGYGLHGTVKPESIGGQASMGCVRLLDDDVELLYEVLVGGISRVSIQN